MKEQFSNRAGRFLLLWCATFLFAFLAGVFQSPAQVYQLTSGNSSVDLYPTSSTGMNNWQVDGVNQLGKQWFWCRDGAYEYSLDTLVASPPTFVKTGNNQLTGTYYDDANYSVTVNWTLSGGALGSGTSSIEESYAIRNAAATTLQLSVFEYADFDIANTANNDTVTLYKDGFNKFNRVVQTDPSGVSSVITVSASADHGEANVYPNTLNSLTDYSPTTLDDNAGPVGPADVTSALEWDLSIGAGDTYTIDILKQIEVPEPSVLSLLAAGLGIWALRRPRPSR